MRTFSPAHTLFKNHVFQYRTKYLKKFFWTRRPPQTSIRPLQVPKLKLTRKEDIKKLILTTAEKFWNSYAFHIYVQQAKKTSKDYKELAELAQRKAKLGHIQPGEIPQILSQYERTLKQQKEMETLLKTL